MGKHVVDLITLEGKEAASSQLAKVCSTHSRHQKDCSLSYLINWPEVVPAVKGEQRGN